MSKRGHNEGSIHERKDRYWTAVVDLGRGPDGKRKRKYIYGKTRREVAEKLKIALRHQQRGLPIAVKRQTIAQFLTHWLQEVAKPSLRPSTYALYESHARVHLLPALGHINLQQLSAQDIQTLINRKVEGGLSKRTVADIHAVLRCALNQAVKWDLVPRNVALLVDRPRVERKEMRYLSPVEARQLLEALYVVTLSLGLRRGEALGLKWSDVELERGVITINEALQRVEGKLQQVEVKTRKSRRGINLPNLAKVALRAHRVH
jgi:integrase